MVTWGNPYEQNDGQTPVKALPSRNLKKLCCLNVIPHSPCSFQIYQMYAKLTGSSAQISSFIFSQFTDPYDVEPDGDFQRFGGRCVNSVSFSLGLISALWLLWLTTDRVSSSCWSSLYINMFPTNASYNAFGNLIFLLVAVCLIECIPQILAKSLTVNKCKIHVDIFPLKDVQNKTLMFVHIF